MLLCGRFSVPSFSEIINIVPIVPKYVKVLSNICDGCGHLAVQSVLREVDDLKKHYGGGIFGVLQTSREICL
jgi:hypothetical protein